MTTDERVAMVHDVDLLAPENRCKDFDEDCPDIAAENGCIKCWAYMPERGVCPYLVEPPHDR